MPLLSPIRNSRLRRSAKRTVWLEEQYDNEHNVGCFLPSHGGEEGAYAEREMEKFRDSAGKDAYLFTDIVDSLEPQNEFGHIASIATFITYERDCKGPDKPFSIFQDSGICVDASNVEMKTGLLATRAFFPQFGEILKYLPAFYQYAERGYCGGGWYMGACASKNLEFGWCPAMQIDIDGLRLDFDEEDESEYAVTKSWCRSGIPEELAKWTKENFYWEPGAITQFAGRLDALKMLFRNYGQLHHGSNWTSRSSTPNNLKRIGGHAQTAFGGMWDEETIKFFWDKGIKYENGDFPVANHQTWGAGWSGECSDRYWPPHWGPKPEGAWICRASQILDYFSSSAYSYLPKLKGFEGDVTPTPKQFPSVEGELRVTDRIIKGDITFDGKWDYTCTPVGNNDFILVPKGEW